MYKLKGNYTVGTKGLCSTDFLIDFIWFLQGKFCSNCSKRNLPLFTGFPLYLMHKIQGCLHRVHRVPVDFKLSIDLAQKRSKYAESTLKSASLKAFVRYHDQNIEIYCFKRSSLKHYVKEIA